MSINLDNAKNFGSYLEKKSHKTFGGYQKRYFRIVEEGNYLAYYDKEKDNINKYKGRIPVDSIKGLQKKEDKKFRIMLKNDERIYHLKAKNKELRDNWVTALELILASRQPKQINTPLQINEHKDLNESRELNDSKELNESKDLNESKELNEPLQINEQKELNEHKEQSGSEISPYLNIEKKEVPEERVEKDYDSNSSEHIIPIEERSVSISSTTSNSSTTKKQKKIEKKNNTKKSKYMKLDNKLLEKKGIVNLLQLSNPDIKKRFYSGIKDR